MGRKIGYMIRERTVEGAKVISREIIATTVNRNGSEVKWVIDKTLRETVDGRPLGFTDLSRISNEVTRTTGLLDDKGRMTVTQEVGGQKKTFVVDYPKGALMPEGERLAAKKHDWKPGSTFRVKRFSPHSAKPQVSVFTVGKKEKIDLLGRVVEAARKAVGNSRDAVKVVRKLAAWVNKRISSKNLSVGYASASEVIRSRQGD
ncbi:MAG: hypothetical protein GWP05_09595, partial [Anaerolineaceae bacterium]|nr:hypothetical protein [Anaerolineaceae bacterium]